MNIASKQHWELYVCRMTYSQLEAHLQMALQSVYDVGEAAAVAGWVLEEYTGKAKHQRRLLGNEQMVEAAVIKLKAALDQLLQHKPVQYVLGYTLFYGLKFQVNESVLIPRPETEELVEWIISAYQSRPEAIRILDIGTGSGCIPVALKKQLPQAVVSAIDVSTAALQTAKQNAANNHADVHFYQLDFLDEKAREPLGNYEVIVSNPPYIPLQEKEAMGKNVTGWEPDTALFVPDEAPLLFYEKIAAFGKEHLLPGGTVFMETHRDYAGVVQQLFMQHGYTAAVKKDMHGNERMVKAVLADN